MEGLYRPSPTQKSGGGDVSTPGFMTVSGWLQSWSATARWNRNPSRASSHGSVVKVRGSRQNLQSSGEYTGCGQRNFKKYGPAMAKTVKWWCSGAEYFNICENDLLMIRNLGLKIGSLTWHIPIMHKYGSTPPPPPPPESLIWVALSSTIQYCDIYENMND